MNKKDYGYRAGIAVSIILLAVSFFLLMYQCLFAKNGSYNVIPDGYVFRYIGVQMTKGNMPYRDIFDHKGPLLYILNYAGALISRDYGIIIIEGLFNAASLILLYVIPLRTGCNKLQSLTIALAAMLFYVTVFNPGNYVEEFALPFILGAYLIFIDYFKHDMINTRRLVINGACFGAVLMLRPNMACLWCIFCIAVLVRCIKDKKAKDILSFLIKFIAGVMAVLVPILIWLSLNGSTKAFFEQFILFNFKYSDSDAILRSFAMMDMLKNPYYCVVFVISALFIILLFRKNRPIPVVFYPFALYFILQSVLFVMAGTYYDHYSITAVPFIVYPLSELLIILNDTKKKIMWQAITVLCIALITGFMLIKPLKTICFASCNGYSSDETKELISTVISETDPGDRITMFGNWDYIYLATDRESASKYTYAKPIIYLNREIYDDYFNELQKDPPKVLILEFTNKDMDSFIDSNNYSIIYESANFIALKKGE